MCAVARSGRVLWGDEMGLGKTLQALVTALYYQAEWPMLIISPSSLRLTWAAEIEKWLGLDKDCVQVKQRTTSAQNPKPPRAPT